MKKNKIKIGTTLSFQTGNFAGLTGTITNVDWKSTHQNAIFGYYHTVQLSNGEVGYIEKGGHWTLN